MPKKTHDGNAWVAFADVYGFKEQVRGHRENLGQLLTQVEEAQSYIEKTISEHTSFFRLSDNIFLATPVISGDNYKTFSILISDLRLAIDAHISRDLPVRGGLAFGRVGLGPNLLIGEPVARAVEYEKDIGLPLVVLPELEAREAGITSRVKPFQLLPFPLKGSPAGIKSAKIVKPRRPAAYIEYARQKYDQTKVEGPASVALAWKMTRDLLTGRV